MGEFFEVAYRFYPRDSPKRKSTNHSKTSGSNTNTSSTTNTTSVTRTSKNLEIQETVEHVTDTGTHNFEQMLYVLSHSE